MEAVCRNIGFRGKNGIHLLSPSKRPMPALEHAASSVIAPPATAQADERAGKLTSSGFPPILRLDRTSISHLQAMTRNEGIAWRALINSEFPKPICPGMSTFL